MNGTLRTERLADDRPLLSFLPPQSASDRYALLRGGSNQARGRNDEGLVAWGIAARIPVGTGTDRFERARAGLDAFASTLLREEASLIGCPAGPIAVASFAFDHRDDSSVMVVPQTVVLRRGGTTWRMTIECVPTPAAGRTAAEQPLDDGLPPVRTADRARYAGSTLRDDLWLDAVTQALAAIDSAAYQKIVLARDVHLWSRSDFDVDAALRVLANRFPSCLTFLVERLIGASPELLVRRSGEQVRSQVLAGTTARGADPEEDAALGAKMLDREKDLREHELAVRSVIESLTPYCRVLESPPEPSVVTLDNVQHLGTVVSGGLVEDRDTHVLTLLTALHPTAAVGGTPREAAVDAIRALEGMSRGRYAGPVGWCTPEGDGEFAIALRCAEMDGDRARLFAGAGIVAGSLPEQELEETWLKLRAMIDVLGG